MGGGGGGRGVRKGNFFLLNAAFLLSTPLFRVFALLVFSLHCYMTDFFVCLIKSSRFFRIKI